MPKTLVAKLSAIVFMIIVVGASVIKFDITAGILALGMLIKAGFEYPLAWAKIALKTMTIHCRYILEYGGKIRENRKKDVSWANI